MSHRISAPPLSALPDERLLSLASQGHERAFETFVHRYRAPLLAFCRRMGLSQWPAEEVLQQALLQVWLALRSGTEVRDPKSWLYRIVHNVTVNAMRRTSEDHARLTDAIHDQAAVGGDASAQWPMALREALAEVVALPRMQREAVLLTAIDGQTHHEVAGTLGISDGAVRGLLYRARATLRGAAGAIAPEPLTCWLTSGASGGAPAAERVAELPGAGGAMAVTAALLKGAVVAVSAGIVVGGAAIGSLHHRGARPAHTAARPPTAGGSVPEGGSSEPGPASRRINSSPARGVPGATGPSPDPAVANGRHLAPSPPQEALPAGDPALPRPGGRRSAGPGTGPSSADGPGSAVPGPARVAAGDGSAGGVSAAGGDGSPASGGGSAAAGSSAAQGGGSLANPAPPETSGGASSSEQEDRLGEPPQRSPGSSSGSEGGRWRTGGTEGVGAEPRPVVGRDELAQARREQRVIARGKR
jgi:RNA polymerase sigma factor (sigma-70 family)